MSSSSNYSEREQFIRTELNRDFYDFPVELESMYSRVYQWLTQQASGIENYIRNANFSLDYYDPNPATEESNWKGASYEFSRLLPAHTIKAYRLLLEIQQALEDKCHGDAILDTPMLSIIDNGCGGGSVTIALLALLINYQDFKLSHKNPIFPIKLYCFGVDPNHVALQIYSKFLEEASGVAKKYLIEYHVNSAIGTLPDHLGEIIRWVDEKEKSHSVIVGMGNVIRPISESYNLFQEMLKRLRVSLNLPRNYGRNIGYQEINALKTLIESNNVDKVILGLIGSDTTNQDMTTKTWETEINLFQKNLKDDLTNHSAVFDLHNRTTVNMLGPKDNFFRKFRNNNNPYPITFELACNVLENSSFISDKDWQRILSEENLLLAWARVRNELSYFNMEDTVEVRLFELNVEEQIRNLRQNLLAYNWKSLNISEMLDFFMPKGENKNPRPLNLCRLEEQILAIAILQTKGAEELEIHDRSFAYRLSKKKQGEFLYEDWYEAHSRYIDEARKIAENKADYIVIRTDLESYFTKIRQDKLSENIIHKTKTYNSRLSEAINLLLLRTFDWEENLGIPQGHAMSGYISDIYLQEIDKKFADRHPLNIEYFRYVDDIILICRPENKDAILNELDQSLSALGLTRSQGKTQVQSTNEFLAETEKDIVLNAISDEHINLLRELYKLDSAHYSLAEQNWWLFLEKYRGLLLNLGVFINVPRLSRKIKVNTNWWNRTFGFWKLTKLPYVGKMEDLDNTESWVSVFIENNPHWVERHSLLRENLQKMFTNGLEILKNSSDKDEIAIAQTKIKFAIYRLGQLGFGELAGQIVTLIIQWPWLVNARRVAQALGLQNCEALLIRIYTETPDDKPECNYIKSAALKGLGEIPKLSQTAINLLSNIVLSKRPSLEKTIASEVLLLERNLENANLAELPTILGATLEDSYLSKNLVLLMAKFAPDTLIQDADYSYTNILNQAVQFNRMKREIKELYRYEPDILRDYYYGSYPDNSKEFRDPPT